MRQKITFTAICVIIIGSFVAVPLFWQWSYRDRLVHAVQIGSTRDEYLKALLEGHLGQGIPRPGYTFWRPFDLHGFIYTIFAYPEWDSSGHLSGYSLYSEISLRGHVYYLASPKGPEVQGLFSR